MHNYNNKTYIYYLILFLLVFLGCEKEESTKPFPKPVSLESPVDGAVIEIDLENGNDYVLTWSALPEVQGDVTYAVLFDQDNTLFEAPVYSSLSDNNGSELTFTISQELLDQVADAAGIRPKNTGVVKWAVDAYINDDTITSVAGSILLKRPTSLGTVPENLFLSGTAIESGADISNAIQFKKTAPGEFELITSLKTGEYIITNSKEGGNTQYYIEEGELYKATTTNTSQYDGDEKPHIIRISFNSATGMIAKVLKFEAVITAILSPQFELSYIGNQKFEAENVTLNYLNPGDPEAPDWLSWQEDRYKFRATTSAGEIYYGSYHDDSMAGVYIDGMTPYSNRPEGEEPNGYFNVYYVVPNDNQWAGCWKLATQFDGANIDVQVDFSPTNADYSHSIVLSD